MQVSAGVSTFAPAASCATLSSAGGLTRSALALSKKRIRYRESDIPPNGVPMKAMFRFAVVLLGVGLFASSLRADEPLYQGLGTTGRKVTAANPEAEKYVVQGIQFLYGFSHGAAIRSFEQAIKFDPTCAMAYWGIAYANGPHVNFPLVPPPAAEAAWKNLQLAKQYANQCTPVEKDLIDALSARYANPQPEDRSSLDKAYADAMRKVWQKHPDDADVG